MNLDNALAIRTDRRYWEVVKAIAKQEDRTLTSVLRMAIRLLCQTKYPELLRHLGENDPSSTPD